MSTSAPPHENAHAAWIDWALLAVLVVMWGSAFAAVKVATQTLAPSWLVALRMSVAAGTLAVWSLAARLAWPGWDAAGKRTWAAFGALGLIGMALPFNLFAWGAQHADSVLMGIVNGASPFFTALLAAAFLKGERLSRARSIGVGLGFAGLLALGGPAAMGAFGPNAAVALMLGAMGAACYAVSNVATRSAPRVDPVMGAFVMCTASALASVAGAFAQAPWPAAPSPLAVALGVILGVGPTGVATALYVFLIRRRGPMFVAYVMYLSPLWAAGVGMLLLGERPGPMAAVALTLILAGVYVGNRERSGQA